MTATGHRPLSHPVVMRDLIRHPPPIDPESVTEMTQQIDALAVLVANLPRQPLTKKQARSAEIIAAELMRRAG